VEQKDQSSFDSSYGTGLPVQPRGFEAVDLAVGIEAGLGILFIAMVLDRILQGVTKRQQKALLRQ